MRVRGMPNDKLYKCIESAGVQGVGKMKLRKEFGAKVSKEIDELLSEGAIFAEKKKGTVTLWSKDNYMEHLVNSDPKFRLIYDLYATTTNKISNRLFKMGSELDKKVSTITSEIIDNKVSTITSKIDKKVSDVTNRIDTKFTNISSDVGKQVTTDLGKQMASMVAEVKASTQVEGNGNHNGNSLTLDQFKMEFDRTITEIPTSIGWVELATIRERVCDKYSISKQNFYSLASELFDQFNDSYELSSGGNEGVTVRGLVHGFVRCI
jgi:hypothetical protein